MTPSCEDVPQIERRIAHDYYCRFHMTLILGAVISSGVLASKGLLELGLSIRVRYPIAVLASYAIFLLLIRIWIWYVSGRRIGFGGGNSGNSGSWWYFGGGSGRSGGGSSSGGFSGYGGGDSGGGGASGSWEGNEAAAVIASQPPASSGTSGGHWWSGSWGGGGGGDNDGWLVIVLLGALIACILGGGVYLVVAAPHILPEAAAQMLLAGTLTRVSKDHHHNWMGGVLRATWIPFVIVLVLATALGWAAHRACPTAPRLIDVFHCPSSAVLSPVGRAILPAADFQSAKNARPQLTGVACIAGPSLETKL